MPVRSIGPVYTLGKQRWMAIQNCKQSHRIFCKQSNLSKHLAPFRNCSRILKAIQKPHPPIPRSPFHCATRIFDLRQKRAGGGLRRERRVHCYAGTGGRSLQIAHRLANMLDDVRRQGGGGMTDLRQRQFSRAGVQPDRQRGCVERRKSLREQTYD